MPGFGVFLLCELTGVFLFWLDTVGVVGGAFCLEDLVALVGFLSECKGKTFSPTLVNPEWSKLNFSCGCIGLLVISDLVFSSLVLMTFSILDR